MNIWLSLLIGVLLLAGNGFFVAAEFALVSARRHRLEQLAAGGGRVVRSAARTAVRGVRELSLMLAGAQLGITLCTLGLGVVAEPAIAHLLEPLLSAVGLPPAAQHPIAFVIALAIVTFLHMVVGEMAPKSWALTAPDRAALWLALPFQGFLVVMRPVLRVLNAATNGLLRLVGVHARDELGVSRTSGQLAILVAESGRMGLLDREEHDLLTRALRVESMTVERVMVPISAAASVPADAGTPEVLEAARRSGHLRVLVTEGDRVLGVVHAREALVDPECSPREAARSLPRLPCSMPVIQAVSDLREARSQLGLVVRPDGRVVGLVSLSDLLGPLLDTAPAAA
ncbi:hemolysin family protein [Bailinhaonella thermotolerans]|uniref:HlyC/CorC family transporter n=1 Tax=Bailinhaonella thermotolerans TaxID=1070861 RepID=A0A3A4BDB3_9ACTN|nr:hemolysin family protein [Bailinhaonella thermotolerans]RJL32198.1 HlyC/CorC family transporter [Bailinhaonella thermotolerans]